MPGKTFLDYRDLLMERARHISGYPMCWLLDDGVANPHLFMKYAKSEKCVCITRL